MAEGEAAGAVAFEALRRALTPVRSPLGDGRILGRDEAVLRAAPDPPASARLLPSGGAHDLRAAREATEIEATTLPLPDLRCAVVVRWGAMASATAGSA
jgi:hypothetical protein